LKNYKDSDYALNRYNEGIVYRFADVTVVVTLADYLADNPDKTEEDFQMLKEFSDADYRKQDRVDNATNKRNVSITELAETLACSEPSAEYAVIGVSEETERIEERLKLAKGALDALTEVQRRRYILHRAHGLTTREIAAIECVNQSKIMKSLDAAKNKISKFLANS